MKHLITYFYSYVERYYDLHRRKDKLQAECNRLKVYGKNFCSLTIASILSFFSFLKEFIAKNKFAPSRFAEVLKRNVENETREDRMNLRTDADKLEKVQNVYDIKNS